LGHNHASQADEFPKQDTATHAKAAIGTHSLILALLAPSQAPLAIEAPHSGAHKGQDCSLCETALFSLHIGGSVVTICTLYHM